MTEIQVCLCSISRHVTLSMFVWIECSGVDVDIRIEFLDGNPIPHRLKQFAQGSRDNTLTQRRGNPTGDKDKFCFH